MRRECYEQMGVFPTDPVWAGERLDFNWAQDWYLWCLFALSYDVGYLAEPMVCYRLHDLSITSTLTQHESIRRCVAADIAVPWMIKQKADEFGLREVSGYCLYGIAKAYGAHLASKQYRSSTSTMTLGEFEDSLYRSTKSEPERNWIRARAFEAMGDTLFGRGIWRPPEQPTCVHCGKIGESLRSGRNCSFFYLGLWDVIFVGLSSDSETKVMVPVARAIG